MSRPPLQGRVEEIVIREPKPSWGSRIGDVLGDVFSGIGAAVREYGPAVLQGLANASSLYGNSSGSSYSYDASPSSLPDYSSSNRTVRIQAPEPIKPRPLPEPRQTPRLMETYGRSLKEQRARRQQQIEDLMANNEQAANRRGIAGQLGQYTQPGAHVQPSRRQPSVDIHPSQGSSQSLADFLNPSRHHSTPVQEDYDWVQDNLARAQRPVTWQEQAMRQQAQQQALRQQQAIDAQIQAAHEQRELAEMQARMLQEQQYQERQALKQHARTARLPESIYRDRVKGPVNVTEQVLQDKVPNDKELEQLFHTLEVAGFQAKNNPLLRMQAERNEDLVKQLLAANMTGSNALRVKDGYIVIGNEAFNSNSAYFEALADLNHFQKNGQHRPLQFPVDPKSVNKNKHDITKQYNALREQILYEIDQNYQKYGPVVGVIKNVELFSRNFPNNQRWDTQGQYGFPGQAITRDPDTREPLRHTSGPQKGEIITKDQYAWYEGQPARAGFLSNYIYGYAAAHAFGHPVIMHGAAQAAGFQVPDMEEILRWQFKSDNPEDIKAYVQGWKDYLSELDERYYLERIRQKQSEK